MDIIQYVDSVKSVFRQFQSLIDSYVFEISQCLVGRDQVKIDICIKRFRNHVNSLVKEIEWKFENFEKDLNHIDVLKRFKQYEEEIETLKECINESKDDYNLLENENKVKQQENAALKNRIKDLESLSDKNEDKIHKLQQNFQTLTATTDAKNNRSSINEKHSKQELEFLKDILKLKEKEQKKLHKDYIDLQKEFSREKDENLISSVLLKQYEETINEYKSQIERCKKLEKVDQRNLMNTKILLNNANDQLQNQEDQLHTDFDLITKLKNEIVTLQHLEDEKIKISSELDTERRSNLIIFKDMEGLQTQLSSIKDALSGMMEKNSKMKQKKKGLMTELQDTKNVQADLTAKNEEMQKCILKIESDYSNLKLKMENVTKENIKLKKDIIFLNTAKSIADDKIKLLKTFIDEFRMIEHDFQARLMSENYSVRSRMDVLKQAYEKLF